MIEKAFKAGTLVMSLHPLEELAQSSSWIDAPLCRYLSLAALIVYLVTFIPFLHIFPKILECNFRGRVSLSLEHNLSLARMRNIIFSAYLFIFIILCDRFTLLPMVPAYGGTPSIRLAICVGLIGAYLLLRLVLYTLILKKKTSYSFGKTEACTAARHMNYSTFILYVTTALISTGICLLVGCEDSVVRTILWIEAGVFYLLNLIRTGEILHSFEGVFVTILYLCGLELFPTAALIASTLL